MKIDMITYGVWW